MAVRVKSPLLKKTKVYVDIPKQVKTDYRNMLISEQTKACLIFAEKMLLTAYYTKGFNNKLYNLADSYVALVYYKGKIIPNGKIYNNKVESSKKKYVDRTTNTEMSGRQAAERFIKQYSPKNRDGWEVVFVAATFYASYLDSGARGVRFDVLSNIADYVSRAFKKPVVVEFNYMKNISNKDV